MIKLMVLGNSATLMGLYMKDTGSEISSMALAKNTGLTGLLLKDFIIMGRKMEKVFTNGSMVLVIQDSGNKMR